MIGLIGGTGAEGRGLALRFAMAGRKVMIGSRNPERAASAAEEVRNLASDLDIQGSDNVTAAKNSQVVIIAVPYAGHKSVLAQIKDHLVGKVVVDVVVPLIFKDGVAHASIIEEGSVAQQAQSILPASFVVGAFHNISAHDLLIPDQPIDCDVVICSDSLKAKQCAIELAQLIPGIRPVDGNGLECSRYVEDFTALLLNINRIYGRHSMVKISGI